MIITLTQGRKAKVWIDCLPPAGYPAQNTIRRVFSPAGRNPRDTVHDSAALELLVPLGARMMYGLLGARLIGQANGELSVEIQVSDFNGPDYAGSLGERFDEVRTGLPEEYANGVLKGVERARGLGASSVAGHVAFDCAAHGRITSSSALFAQMALTVMSILELGSASEPSVRQLLEERLRAEK